MMSGVAEVGRTTVEASSVTALDTSTAPGPDTCDLIESEPAVPVACIEANGGGSRLAAGTAMECAKTRRGSKVAIPKG
jgi:hypothetical protein